MVPPDKSVNSAASCFQIFLANFIHSLFKGKPAGENPWNATTLEWSIPSPPPHDNFGEIEPQVYHGAYEYSVPGEKEDFIMQTDAEKETVEH